MIDNVFEVNRKNVKKDRIAICPKFGCKYLEKIKPLKFGVFGFRKYPKCPLHELSLVFIDEFIENFIQAVNACLFDISGLPPKTLLKSIMEKTPNEIMNVIKGWIFCNPIGRGAQIVSEYMDGLSRSYIKLLNRKQRKSVQDQETSKKRYNSLRAGLNKVAEEYSNFLQKIRTKSELIDDRECLNLKKSTREVLNLWLKEHLNEIRSSQKENSLSLQINQLSMIKIEYDKILHAGTCSLLLGKSPAIVIKGLSAFELFSAYHSFLKADLCREMKVNDLEILIAKIDKKEKDKSRRLNIQSIQEEKLGFLEDINYGAKFKENLIRLLARMSYTKIIEHFGDSNCEKDLDLETVEIILKVVFHSIRKIKRRFYLDYLNETSKDKFEENLDDFIRTVDRNEHYKEDLFSFTRGLIIRIYDFITKHWNSEKNSIIEDFIRNDLNEFAIRSRTKYSPKNKIARLLEFAKNNNLTLLSDENDYKTKESNLKWKCLSCNYVFTKCVRNLRRNKYICENCKSKKKAKEKIIKNSNNVNHYELKRDGNLFEVIGVILGDGNIGFFPEKYKYRLTITLNEIDESNYVKYVFHLLRIVFNKDPIIDDKVIGKGLMLCYYSKKIVNSIIELGLKPGDKTYNQVTVPNFILKNKNSYIPCLKGLFDTDGSITINNKGLMILGFTNSSKALVDNFYFMCKRVGIISKYKNISRSNPNAWRLRIFKKADVKGFLEIVKPEKIKEPYRRTWLTLRILVSKSSEEKQILIRKFIKNEMKKAGKKIFQYSKENTIILKNFYENEFGIKITSEVINSELKNVLNEEVLNFDSNRAKRWKYLIEKIRSPTKLVEYLKFKGENEIPSRNYIIKHIKRYMEEEGLDFSDWYNQYPPFSFHFNNNKVTRFPTELKFYLIEMIMKILYQEGSNIKVSHIIKRMNIEFNKMEDILMLWFLENPKYSNKIIGYLDSLIYLCKKVIYVHQSDKSRAISDLCNDKRISNDFSYSQIKVIIRYLKRKKFLI